MNGRISRNIPKKKNGIVTKKLMDEPIPIQINLIIKPNDLPILESSWNNGSEICLAIGKVFVMFIL